MVLAAASATVMAQIDKGTTSADYLNSISDNGHIFGSNINMSWLAHDNIGAGSIEAGAYGFMRWTDTSSGPGDFAANGLGYGTATTFFTLCSQFVPLNDPSSFHVWDISGGTNAPPLPGYRFDTLYRGASVISRNVGSSTAFGVAFNQVSASDKVLHGAAIQLAVWAAIYSNGSAWGGYNTSTNTLSFGGFTAQDSHSNFDNIVSVAMGYYESARNYGGANNWGMGTNASTYWFDSQKIGSKWGQDQMTVDPLNPPQSVPEPFTMGLGIAGVAVYLRRRKAARFA